ncbi:MAG TPA: DUF4861 family protein [Bacteroidales bacterium]|jgi:hypothetical protein|nr:MAG: hypothetical protein BWX77_01194 [Bacteroidetes bacterium ADurb.Bin090]HOD27057.1 DUF4861 family protein [Bacteroidales bacterium]HQM93552.1 DUF4861 family protein [Bacteroidales bacterium]
MKKASFLIAFIALLFSSCCKENALIVQVNNPSALDRERESIEIKLDDIKNALEDKNDTACSFVVYDAQGLEIPSQLVLSSTPAVLLFQATVKAGDSCTYTIKKGEPMPYETMVQTTFMPRRKDDMSWENDKISFRMYGPALVTDPKEGMVSGGLDIWVKRTSKLVTQQWYQDEFDGKSTYHHDNGEGLDFYAVGTTLGAGALAPYVDDKLWLVGNNFVSYKILENGPIRTTFALEYETYDCNSKALSETRTISLDAGSHLNKFSVLYKGNDGEVIPVAAGFPFRGFEQKKPGKKELHSIDDCNSIAYDKTLGYVAYAEPEHAENGILFLGSLMPEGSDQALIGQGHVLNSSQATIGKEFVYYSGGGWSKGGFQDLAAWTAYMKDFALKLREPLKVNLKAACVN